MPTKDTDYASEAEAIFDLHLLKREPAQPQSPPYQPVTGIRSDGAQAARRTIASDRMQRK